MAMEETLEGIDFCTLVVTRPSDGQGVPLACSLDGERVWAISDKDLDRHRAFKTKLSAEELARWQDRVEAAHPKIFERLFVLEAREIAEGN